MIGNLLTLITTAAAFGFGAVAFQLLLSGRVRVPVRNNRTIALPAIDSDES